MIASIFACTFTPPSWLAWRGTGGTATRATGTPL
jgi:hypothetical protein